MDLGPLTLVFLTGLTAGFGHCLGMCGGFVYAYSLKDSQMLQGSERPLSLQMRFHFLYHAGRILTYAILGGAIGYLGSTLRLALGIASLRGLVPLAAGLLMVVMSLGLVGVWPKPAIASGRRSSLSGRFFDTAQKPVRRLMSSSKPWATFPLGIMMGFLPCGFLALMEIRAAAAGSFWGGMLIMSAFGLGTIPALLALGLVSSTVGRRLRGYFLYAASVFAILLGLMSIAKGIHFYLG